MNKLTQLIIVVAISLIASSSLTQNTVDTIEIHDTVYLFDTIVIQDTMTIINRTIAKDSTESIFTEIHKMREDFYNKAVDALDSRNTFITIILTIIGFVVIFMGIFSYLASKDIKKETKRSHDLSLEVEKRMNMILDKSTEAIDKFEKEAEQKLDNLKGMEKSAVQRVNELTISTQQKSDETSLKLKKIEESAKELVGEARTRAKGQNIVPKDITKLIDEKDAQKAVDDFEILLFELKFQDKSLQDLPSSLLKNMGRNYNRLKRYGDARELFEIYVEKNKNDTYVLFDLGVCYYHLERYKESINAYERVVLLDDKYSVAYFNLCSALLKLWHIEPNERLLVDIKEISIKALEITPKELYHNYNIARVEALLGNKKEMLTLLKIAVEFDPIEKKTAREDKNFEKYRDDDDFKALIKEEVEPPDDSVQDDKEEE